MPSSTHDSEIRPASQSSFLDRFLDALVKKPMILLSALLSLIVIAAVGVAFYNQQQAKAQAANNALYQAQKSLETETKALIAPVAAPLPVSTAAPAGGKAPAAHPAEPSADLVQFRKVDVDAKFPETLKKLKQVIEGFSGTRAAFEAQMTMGSLYHNHGQAAQAVPWFEQASLSAPRGEDQTLAQSSLGYALEGASKYAEAVQAFEKALSHQGTSAALKADLLFAIARNQELRGDRAKARQAYDQIIQQQPNSEQAHSAELLKSQIQ